MVLVVCAVDIAHHVRSQSVEVVKAVGHRGCPFPASEPFSGDKDASTLQLAVDGKNKAEEKTKKTQELENHQHSEDSKEGQEFSDTSSQDGLESTEVRNLARFARKARDTG